MIAYKLLIVLYSKYSKSIVHQFDGSEPAISYNSSTAGLIRAVVLQGHSCSPLGHE
jgi:hypothetical protein